MSAPKRRTRSLLLQAAVSVLIVLAVTFVGFAKYRPSKTSRRVSRMKVIQLPEPKVNGPVTLEQLLSNVNVTDRFTGEKVNFEQVGQLLWAANMQVKGMLAQQKRQQSLSAQDQAVNQTLNAVSAARSARTPRSARSARRANAAVEVEILVAVPSGVYRYNAEDNTLEQNSMADVRAQLAASLRNNRIINGAGCNIIIAGSYSTRGGGMRKSSMLRKRMLLLAGRTAQNISLQASVLKLGTIAETGFDSAVVRKYCRTSKRLEPLCLIFVGRPASTDNTDNANRKNSGTVVSKKAAVIVPSRNFQDAELFETVNILNSRGVETVIVSSTVNPLRGHLGGTVRADVLISNIKVDDYDAIVFIDGPGIAEYINNPAVLTLVRNAVSSNKVVAAISLAPDILANAGVLRGVRVTAYITEAQALRKAGAIYTGSAVERHGRIITASAPISARAFARTIVDSLARSK